MNALRLLAAALAAAATLSAHAVGRLADVTITDRTTGRALPVHWHEGRAYVVGAPGDEYEVAVRNRTPGDLLAVVSVDGVNVVSGETASERQSGYVLDRWNRVDIRGWRKSIDEVAAFYFTPLGDSYAARTGRPDNVGVIGVALFRRATSRLMPAQVAPPSADANAAEKRAPAAAAPEAALGTGHGRRENSPVREVPFDRATREPTETIAIYYDSYPNLVALGVIDGAGAMPPRDPQPFPKRFVPDPPR